jgi:hypothetical protein
LLLNTRSDEALKASSHIAANTIWFLAETSRNYERFCDTSESTDDSTTPFCYENLPKKKIYDKYQTQIIVLLLHRFKGTVRRELS